MQNILFNVPMTKAILDGRKVQTRRAIPKKFKNIDFGVSRWWDGVREAIPHESVHINKLIRLAKYQIGKTIWVREPAKVIKFISDTEMVKAEYLADNEEIVFTLHNRFSEKLSYPKWIIEMQGIPNGCIKEMARIFLKITDVRVERLQDISNEDILSEGFVSNLSIDQQSIGLDKKEAKEWWIDLWNSTAPKGYKWEDNPYVFVYELERVGGFGSTNKKDFK